MKVFSSQQSVFRVALVALVGVVMAGCNMIGEKDKEPDFRLSDLQGLWLETHVTDVQHYVRFTTEQADEPGYFYGREWHEEDDVYESDLKPYGNGWFKYLFETKDGGLTEIHLMDNGGAEIPMVYVVSKLTETELEYYDQDRKQRKFYFEKVTESTEEEKGE